MGKNLVIIGPGRRNESESKQTSQKEDLLQFLVVEKLGEDEFRLLSQAIDAVSQFDRSLDIARIVLNSFDRFMETYRESFFTQDEIGFGGFREMNLRLMGDLLDLGNAVYTYVQHQKVAIKREFGKVSPEMRSLELSIDSTEPYNSFVLAIRNHFVHSEIRLDGVRSSDAGGVKFSPTVRIDELRKSGERGSPINKHLAALEDQVEVVPFILAWRPHFEGLLVNVYDIRSKPFRGPAVALLEKARHFPPRPGEVLALAETPDFSSTEGNSNFRYRVIELETCEAISAV